MRRYLIRACAVLTALGLVVGVMSATNVGAAGPTVANSSIESVTSGVPDGWNTRTDGDHRSGFNVVGPGNSGSKALRVWVADHQSGASYWWFDQLEVSPGQEYRYREFYKSSAPSSFVEVEFVTTSGEYIYERIATPPAAATWTELNASFTAPPGAERMTVFHGLERNGTVFIDDATIETSGSQPAPNASTNQVLNPSFEVLTDREPNGWETTSEGNLRSGFNIVQPGRTGDNAARVWIADHVSGKAFWYLKPISVVPGTSYTYSEYYKSTSPASFVEVEFVTADGSFIYDRIATLSKSSDWTGVEATFTAPAGAQTMTIFHGLERNGTVFIDDVAVTTSGTTTGTPPSSGGGTSGGGSTNTGGTTTSANIANPSAEMVVDRVPDAWNQTSAGTHRSGFNVTVPGRTGANALKVWVADHQSGKAFWWWDQVAATPGQTYNYSSYYKSSAQQSFVEVEFVTSDGQYIFERIAVGGPTSQWTKIEGTFVAPAGAELVTVYHALERNGTLYIDDVSLTKVGAPGTPPAAPTAPTTPSGVGEFDRALVSIEFDDGWTNSLDNGIPIVENYGFKATMNVITDTMDRDDDLYITESDVLDLVSRGHGISSHSVSHADLAAVSASERQAEMADSDQRLETLLGEPVDTLVLPYCSTSAAVRAAAQANYSQMRGCGIAVGNTKAGFDHWAIESRVVEQTTTTAEISQWVADAQAANAWLVIVYHEIQDANPQYSPLNVTPAQLDAHMQAIRNSGVAVVTTGQAIDEIDAQL